MQILISPFLGIELTFEVEAFQYIYRPIQVEIWNSIVPFINFYASIHHNTCISWHWKVILKKIQYICFWCFSKMSTNIFSVFVLKFVFSCWNVWFTQTTSLKPTNKKYIVFDTCKYLYFIKSYIMLLYKTVQGRNMYKYNFSEEMEADIYVFFKISFLFACLFVCTDISENF